MTISSLRTNAQYDQPDFSAIFSFEKHFLTKMTETGGGKPEYNHYRVMSRRHFMEGKLSFPSKSAVHLKLGQATIQTHSSEGETTYFNARNCIGLGVSQILPVTPLPNDPFLELYAGYLFLSVTDPATSATAKGAFNSGGEVEMDWKETELAATTHFPSGNKDLFTGVHYTGISISQDRSFYDHTDSSKLKPDDTIGIHAGISHTFLNNINTSFTATILNETAIKFTALYTF